MSYHQTTDIKFPNKLNNDFKNNLIKSQQMLKTIKLNQNISVQYKKDKWYYVVEDVAIWTKCGNIRTVLFYRLKNRPKGKVINFHGKEQFIFEYKGKYAIYNIGVYARNTYNHNIITHVSFTKVPNLQECSC